MMKKVWLVLLAVVLVFGLAMLGCGGKSSGSNEPDPGTEPPPEFTADGPFTYELYGNNKPVLGDDGFLAITASSSTGFIIKFADIEYTYDARDILTFTYEIEVETPVAVIIAKTPSMGDLGSQGNAGWGKGKGWEYALGDATRSVYEGPNVNGTWDAATKTGTFQVMMKIVPPTATGIGFQHNFWADDGGNGIKIAENSKYKVKITKIENGTARGEIPGGGGEEPDPNIAFDAAVGLKDLAVGGDGAQISVDTDTGVISRDVGNGYGNYFTVAIPANQLPIIASDKIVIKYIGVNNAPLTTKKNTSLDDIAPADYATFTGDGKENTKELTAVRYGDTLPTSVLYFQGRPNEVAWKLKIISITVVHGDPIKVTSPVAGIRPAADEPPEATVETAQFNGTVSWSPTVASTFIADTVYTATIALTAKDGYTFAGIEANTFPVTGAETVTHVAGTTTTLSISAKFPATAPLAEDYLLTFAAGSVKATGTTSIVIDDENTFTVTNGSPDYQGAVVYFKVTFPDGHKVSDYAKIDIDTKANNSGAQWKPLRIAAYKDEPTSASLNTGSGDIIAAQESGNPVGSTGDGVKHIELDIGAVKPEADLNEVWIGICVHAGSGAEYTLSNIKFYN